MKGRGESLFMPGVKIVVSEYLPPGSICAVCDAGLPADVEARLQAMPEGPERDEARFVELAQRGYVVVAKDVKP